MSGARCERGPAMKPQLDRSRPIPDTTVFDVRLSCRGYRLNKMCGALCAPEYRAAFKADEEACMAKFGLSEQEKALVRSRDFAGLIQSGLNIYFMLKLGAATGNGLYRMGAQMRGESYEQFLATRNVKDAV
jgi:protocatechuate 4,5-dioxygenase, alpha chain